MKVTWKNSDKARNRRALKRPEQPIIDALCTLLGDRDLAWEFVDVAEASLALTIDEHSHQAQGMNARIDVIVSGPLPDLMRNFTLRHRSSSQRRCSVGRVAREIYRWARPAASAGFDVDARVRFVGEPPDWIGAPPRGEVGRVVKIWPFTLDVEIDFPSVWINHWYGVDDLELVEGDHPNENPRQGGHQGGGSREGKGNTRASGKPESWMEDT